MLTFNHSTLEKSCDNIFAALVIKQRPLRFLSDAVANIHLILIIINIILCSISLNKFHILCGILTNKDSNHQYLRVHQVRHITTLVATCA